ncbi:sialic acid-binding Ig-like lectin 6 isoform X4 [Carassius gibelio]|uniref:sialic acid-binding Ig-like lectin 6 isoform X3 n=1 Tax=Carassius gibelio TaxID=101364 RepID=UPI002279B8A0|nr:sialic acid-binding Ig-like lectin 6 isoform X3 [Carassius gibelio]XP_052432713.1 sialic acid-binding Ig-like lectin 6 isoform X3 [Carassius gibelio]XP_052432714.1 sialic acid-binding Ig-like lectin 6 isoform X4 [Carassius gibelio]
MHIISCCTILFILTCRVQTNENDTHNDWKITFNPPEVTAVSGLCALISCTFIHPDKDQAQIDQENVCNNQTECKNETEIQIEGKQLFETEQIKLLEPDLTKYNCSRIIKEIKEDEREIVFKIVQNKKTLSKASVKIIIQDEPIMKIPPLREGEKADLTCSAPFPCPETSPNITWWIRKRGGNITDLKDNITLSTSESLYLSTLTLTPTSDDHNATVGCNMSYGSKIISTNRTLNFTSVKNLNQVMEGGTLRLNCTVESHPPSSDPVWSFNGNIEIFMNQTSAGSVTITNVTKEHAGVYSCMRTYQNKTLNALITINILSVTTDSKVNESSSPKGKNNTQNDITSTTGIIDFLKNWDIPKIVTFVAGMVCSALIFSVVLCCCVSCHRGKKHKVPITNPDTEVNLEMVQTDTAQTGTNEETPLQGQLNGGNPNTTGVTDGAEEDEAVRMEGKEVDYASIDYSLLKDRPPEEEEKEPTDTDYAEIKKDKIGDGKQKEVLQDGDDQIETQDQMEGEETRYSNSEELKI